MNINELSKSQLLLLALLVSFITSIATGVLTVSLLEENPQTVTQTVNRVVERTIEKVVQAETSENQGAAVITRETTVVVKEDTVLSDSISAHSRRVVTLHAATTTAPVSGMGLIFPRRGLIVTATTGLPSTTPVALFANGQSLELELVFGGGTGDAVAVLRPKLAEGQAMPTAPTYEFASLDGLKRGQSVSTLSARGAVETGIISLVQEAGVETSIADSRVSPGSTLITTLGNIIGMRVRASTTGATFIAGEEIIKAIDAYTASLSESGT